jgi:hypothetical protein
MGRPVVELDRLTRRFGTGEELKPEAAMEGVPAGTFTFILVELHGKGLLDGTETRQAL